MTRSEIFKIAAAFRRAGASLSQALKTAWEFKKTSSQTPKKIAFAKAQTGEIREAICTHFSALKSGVIKFTETLSDGTVQWRSFRAENICF